MARESRCANPDGEGVARNGEREMSPRMCVDRVDAATRRTGRASTDVTGGPESRDATTATNLRVRGGRHFSRCRSTGNHCHPSRRGDRRDESSSAAVSRCASLSACRRTRSTRSDRPQSRRTSGRRILAVIATPPGHIAIRSDARAGSAATRGPRGHVRPQSEPGPENRKLAIRVPVVSSQTSAAFGPPSRFCDRPQ